MAITDLTSAQLQELLVLITEKEELQKKLAVIESSIAALESGQTKTVTKSPKLTRQRRKGAPLKIVIIEALKSAGKAGLTLDELAKNTGGKKGSVAVWFYTTGKKIKQIKKLGRGRFTWA